MKKFRLSNTFLIIAACVAVLAAFVVIGLTTWSRASYYKLALDNLAEARFYMKQDESTNLRVQFFTGMRENPYNINGVAETTTAFAVINVEPKDSSLVNYIELKGTLKIGEELVEVTLDKNPYDNNFATDIARLVDIEQELVFVLNLDSDTVSFNLKRSMPENAISWENALEIATQKLTDNIKSAGQFECYIKIIYDLTKSSGSFWYVQFVCKDGKTFFCVIDPAGTIIG